LCKNVYNSFACWQTFFVDFEARETDDEVVLEKLSSRHHSISGVATDRPASYHVNKQMPRAGRMLVFLLPSFSGCSPFFLANLLIHDDIREFLILHF